MHEFTTDFHGVTLNYNRNISINRGNSWMYNVAFIYIPRSGSIHRTLRSGLDKSSHYGTGLINQATTKQA